MSIHNERTYRGIEISVRKMRSGWYRGEFEYPGYKTLCETPTDHSKPQHALDAAQDVIDHMKNDWSREAAYYKTLIGEKAEGK